MKVSKMYSIGDKVKIIKISRKFDEECFSVNDTGIIKEIDTKHGVYFICFDKNTISYKGSEWYAPFCDVKLVNDPDEKIMKAYKKKKKYPKQSKLDAEIAEMLLG
jgi:hypothetical protein